MNNVELSLVQGSVKRICQGLASKMGVFALGAAFLSAPLAVSTVKAEESAITQIQYVQWLAQVSAAGLAANASSDALIAWAKSQGINPDGGWKAGDKLSSDALKQTLVQALGL